MSSLSETVLVPVGREAALAACRRALSPEVWELDEDCADRLVANEWPWRISCHTRPARIEISVKSSRNDQTTLRLDGTARGFGQAASNHLRNHFEALTTRIRRVV